jgi:hypothetical protein
MSGPAPYPIRLSCQALDGAQKTGPTDSPDGAESCNPDLPMATRSHLARHAACS